MSEEFKNIDTFFREQLKDISTETKRDRWIFLYHRLFWKKWGTIISVLIIVILAVTGLFLIKGTENIGENFLRNFQYEETHDIVDTTKKSLPGRLDYQQNTIQDSQIFQNDLNESAEEQVFSDDSDILETLANHKAPAENIKDIKANLLKGLTLPDYFEPTLLSMNSIRINEFIPIDRRQLQTVSPLEFEYKMKDPSLLKTPGFFRNVNVSFGIFLSPSFVDKTLQSDGPDNAYINLRKLNEKEIFVAGLGAEIKFTFHKVFFQTGIEYAIYGEDVKYNFTTQNVDIENSYYDYDTSWVWIYDPPFYGEPHISSIDSSWMPVYEKISMTSSVKNRYHYIELPLVLGFGTNFKKVNLEAGTGITAGWLISVKGNLPDYEINSLLELNTSSDFLERITINYILNAGIEYKLNEKWSIILKPNYKRNLSSVLEKSHGIKQKYSTFGVISGFRIKL